MKTCATHDVETRRNVNVAHCSTAAL